jgi:hypothetical protein
VTVELREFIEQRITEDELWAKAASAQPSYYTDKRPVPSTGVHWTWAVGENWTPYKVDPLEEFVGDSADDYGPTLVTVEEWPSSFGKDRMSATKVLAGEEVASGVGGHIVRHDPARVLRDVEAKRRLLAQHQAVCDEVRSPKSAEHRMNARARQFAFDEVLATLALPYADHPDYNLSWTLEATT